MRPVYASFALLCCCFPVLAQRIPEGTSLAVRLDATVSSRSAHVGDIVPASLARDLVVHDRLLARAGIPLRGRVTYARRSGRFHKPGYLTIRLSSIDIEGRRYYLDSTAIRDKVTDTPTAILRRSAVERVLAQSSELSREVARELSSVAC